MAQRSLGVGVIALVALRSSCQYASGQGAFGKRHEIPMTAIPKPRFSVIPPELPGCSGASDYGPRLVGARCEPSLEPPSVSRRGHLRYAAPRQPQLWAPPVEVAEQRHRCRHQETPHDGHVEKHGDADSHAQLPKWSQW